MIELNYSMIEKGYQTKAEFGDLVVSGEDQYGFRPYFLLVSSVVGCSGSRLRKELEALELTYEDIKVKADVTRNAEEANRVEKIHLTFKIKSKNIPSEKLEEVRKEVYKKSAMIQSVKDSIEITTTLLVN